MSCISPHASWGRAGTDRPAPFRQPRALFLRWRLCCSRWIWRAWHGRLAPRLLGVVCPSLRISANLLGLVHSVPLVRRGEIPRLKRRVVRAWAGTLRSFRSSFVVWCEASRRWAQVARLEGVDERGRYLDDRPVNTSNILWRHVQQLVPAKHILSRYTQQLI